MLSYLTDYENDRWLFRPRVVNAILVLMPFMVLYRATELWFGDMYLFDFMKRSQYGLMWFCAVPYFGISSQIFAFHFVWGYRSDNTRPNSWRPNT